MAARETDRRDHETTQGYGQGSAVRVTAPAPAGTAEHVRTAAAPEPPCGLEAARQDLEGEAAGRPETGPRPDDRSGQLSDAMACVARFHQAFNLPRASTPDAGIPAELAKLRVDLLVEETGEFADATAKSDIVAIADALADIVYVAYGAAVTYGIDLDAAVREVHRSNMSKLDDHGRPVYREDGKVLKSSRYMPPDISGVLMRQSPLPF